MSSQEVGGEMVVNRTKSYLKNGISVKSDILYAFYKQMLGREKWT